MSKLFSLIWGVSNLKYHETQSVQLRYLQRYFLMKWNIIKFYILDLFLQYNFVLKYCAYFLSKKNVISTIFKTKSDSNLCDFE